MLAQIDPDKIIDYFHVEIYLWTVRQHCTGNVSCAMLTKPDQENILQVLFPRKNDYVLRVNIVQVIFLRNVVSDVFKQHRLDDIPMQCWESLEQHSTHDFYLCNVAQRLKTTLNMIFSYVMLSGASRRMLHKVFPVQCCPRR